MRRINEQSQNGFTLIEVLVAFTILSISLIILFRSIGVGAQNYGYVERKTIALRLAQSKLASVGYDIPLKVGNVKGREDNMQWMIKMVPYNRTVSQSKATKDGIWVEVVVKDYFGKFKRPVHVMLSSFKLK